MALNSGRHEWLGQRISALLLWILLPIAFAIMLGVALDVVNYTDLHRHLHGEHHGHDHATPAITFTWPAIIHTIILCAVLIHAFIGIKVILDDYLHIAIRRTIALTALYIISFTLLLQGLYVIWLPRGMV